MTIAITKSSIAMPLFIDKQHMLATIALYSDYRIPKAMRRKFSGFVRMIFTIVHDLKEFIVVLFVIFAPATHVFVLRAHARGSYGEDDFRGARVSPQDSVYVIPTWPHRR